MWRLALVSWIVLVACDDAGSAVDATGPSGACDAVPVAPCALCTRDTTCVFYDTQSGYPSCTDYDLCVATTLSCAPGNCTPECEAELCPRPYACDPTATERFTCTRP